MSLYTDLAASAADLIAEFGAPATITRKEAGDYDPQTRSLSTTEKSIRVVACILDMPERRIDGTRILAGDKQAFISTRSPEGAGLEWPPHSDMRLTDAAGVSHAVIAVKPLAPAVLTVVMYEAQLRRLG